MEAAFSYKKNRQKYVNTKFNMLQLTPHETIHWQPEPGISVQVRTFCAFLKTMHAPERFHDFTTRRYMRFTPDDFIHPFLCPGELETVNRFKSLKKQIEWMAGRRLVKEMVGYATAEKVDPSEITIDYRDEGAPFLPLYPEIQISITHSGRYAAVALCCDKDRTLGLDLEKIGPPPDTGFMKLAFTPREREDTGEDPEKIFRNWTLKEAYLKYIKRGFNESLHQVEIHGDVILHRGTRANVNIFCATIGREYAISLITDHRGYSRPG